MEAAGLQDVTTASTPVVMVEPEIVRQLRVLTELRWGYKRIARELGISKTTVKRYQVGGTDAEIQRRQRAGGLDEAQRAKARALFDTTAEGNAVVVKQLLAEQGVDVDVRVVQRVLQPHRQEKRAAEAATVRFETEPGHQLQIDFGEKHVVIAGQRTRVMLFVAVLGFSRRCYVHAFRSQRHDDWREGLAGAFHHFGGVTQTVLVDNAKALVLEHVGEVLRVNPAFEAFCKDWGVGVRACRPYRARTKGKTESGVKYAKQNALAGREFSSWAALESHLVWWMQMADERDHGTTHEAPRARFERSEAAALRPLPTRPIPVRQRREPRKVSSDCFVDIDTVRYSVPHRLVGRSVQVLVADDEIVVFDGTERVARHARCSEPYQRVVDVLHFEGLHRVTTSTQITSTVLAPYGRSLSDYAAHIGGAP